MMSPNLKTNLIKEIKLKFEIFFDLFCAHFNTFLTYNITNIFLSYF